MILYLAVKQLISEVETNGTEAVDYRKFTKNLIKLVIDYILERE
ncbi:MAG: hypothetical protein PQJ59_16715 [Spirochaetales bacterium]|nr:hypothetical protein [Spirochaetales bacterium]